MYAVYKWECIFLCMTTFDNCSSNEVFEDINFPNIRTSLSNIRLRISRSIGYYVYIYVHVSKYTLLMLRMFPCVCVTYTCERMRVYRLFACILFQQLTFCFGVYFSYISRLSVCPIYYTLWERKEKKRNKKEWEIKCKL